MERGQVRSPKEDVVVREGLYQRGGSNSIFKTEFQFNAYPRKLLRLEAPSRGHLICFIPLEKKLFFFLFGNCQGSQQVAWFQKLVLVECVCPQHRRRHPQLPPTFCPPAPRSLLAKVTSLLRAQLLRVTSLAFWMLRVSSSLNTKRKSLRGKSKPEIHSPK